MGSFSLLRGGAFAPTPPHPIPPELQFFVFRIGLYDLELRWHHLSLSLAFLNIRVAKPDAHGDPEASNIMQKQCNFNKLVFPYVLLLGASFPSMGRI